MDIIAQTKGKIILMDFDGTLSIFEGVPPAEPGPPVDGVLEFIPKLHELGWKIHVFSGRLDYPGGLKQIEDWLTKYNIPYDAIIPGKPTYNVIVDDNSISPSQHSWKDIYEQIVHKEVGIQKVGFIPGTQDAEFSCLLLALPDDLSKLVLDWIGKNIPDNILFDKEDKGKEEYPHITVKYGIHAEDPEQVIKLLEGEKSVSFSLGQISLFDTGEDFDVVKIEVKSKDLEKLNKKVSQNIEVTDTHPGYIPHVTLAFVQKGFGDNFKGMKDFDGLNGTVNKLVFSSSKKEKGATDIPLTGKEVAVNATELPDAIFVGMFPKTEGRKAFPLFNIVKSDHPRKGSTVSTETLQQLGLKVPTVPEYYYGLSNEEIMKANHDLRQKLQPSPKVSFFYPSLVTPPHSHNESNSEGDCITPFEPEWENDEAGWHFPYNKRPINWKEILPVLFNFKDQSVQENITPEDREKYTDKAANKPEIFPAEKYFAPEVLEKIMEHNKYLWNDTIEAMALKSIKYLQEWNRQLWDENKAAESVARAYGTGDIRDVYNTPIMKAVLDQVMEWARKPPVKTDSGLQPNTTWRTNEPFEPLETWWRLDDNSNNYWQQFSRQYKGLKDNPYWSNLDLIFQFLADEQEGAEKNKKDDHPLLEVSSYGPDFIIVKKSISTVLADPRIVAHFEKRGISKEDFLEAIKDLHIEYSSKYNRNEAKQAGNRLTLSQKLQGRPLMDSDISTIVHELEHYVQEQLLGEAWLGQEFSKKYPERHFEQGAFIQEARFLLDKGWSDFDVIQELVNAKIPRSMAHKILEVAKDIAPEFVTANLDIKSATYTDKEQDEISEKNREESGDWFHDNTGGGNDPHDWNSNTTDFPKPKDIQWLTPLDQLVPVNRRFDRWITPPTARPPDFLSEPMSNADEVTNYDYEDWQEAEASLISFRELKAAEEKEKTLYEYLFEAGIPMDHHESDLYVLDTPEAAKAIGQYSLHTGIKVKLIPFKSQLDGKMWLEIPFAYAPFWDKTIPQPKDLRLQREAPEQESDFGVSQLRMLPEMSTREKQVAIDKLLDQYSKETDPKVKELLVTKIKELKSQLAKLLVKIADATEDQPQEDLSDEVPAPKSGVDPIDFVKVTMDPMDFREGLKHMTGKAYLLGQAIPWSAERQPTESRIRLYKLDMSQIEEAINKANIVAPAKRKQLDRVRKAIESNIYHSELPSLSQQGIPTDDQLNSMFKSLPAVWWSKKEPKSITVKKDNLRDLLLRNKFSSTYFDTFKQGSTDKYSWTVTGDSVLVIEL